MANRCVAYIYMAMVSDGTAELITAALKKGQFVRMRELDHNREKIKEYGREEILYFVKSHFNAIGYLENDSDISLEFVHPKVTLEWPLSMGWG